MENIRGYDLPYIHAIKTHIENLTEELIQLRRSNKEQHKTLNRVDNFLEYFCSGNVHQKSYTAINNTYKINKTDVDITSEYNDNGSVYVKPVVSSSKPF